MDILTTIASSEPAVLLRGSFWIYPLVNAAHILGIALLIGAIVPFDLRLMGVIKAGRIRTLAGILVPVAASGLALAAVTGAALFIVKPVDYAQSDLFVIKLAVIGVGLINVGWVRSIPRWSELVQAEDSILNPTEPNRKLRIAAAVSIVAWVVVLLLGRMTGYFM
ncbi:MAG: hypothetical protein JJ855_14480 [Rhodospirillales bacterium]|nr:hypothetical protein [Rhodospirillales bacterium]